MSRYSRELITSYRDFITVKRRYPNRIVGPSIYAPNGYVYYFNPIGRVRALKLKDNTVWETDYERGFPYMRRIK